MIRVGNQNGIPVASMSVTNYGGLISAGNVYGNLVIGVAAEESGGTLEIINRDGKLLTFIGTDKYGGIVSVRNKEGFPVVGMAAEGAGSGVIDIFDKNGKLLSNLP